MKDAVEMKDQAVDEINEVKEDKVWKILGLEIKRVKKVKEPKEAPEGEETENQEAKPESKGKKFLKNARIALAIGGAAILGTFIGKALDCDCDGEAYELTTGEFEPVGEAQTDAEKAESENPKDE